MIMTIEEYLNKTYWVIEILPKQVPADGKGQYFKIEKYYLEHPQIDPHMPEQFDQEDGLFKFEKIMIRKKT